MNKKEKKKGNLNDEAKNYLCLRFKLKRFKFTC